MRIAVFASGDVGRATLSAMVEAGRPPIAVVGYVDEIDELAQQVGLSRTHAFSADELESSEGVARLAELDVELGILAWWNRLVRGPLLTLPRLGYLNFHPTYLPYNRGRQFNFWTLAEDTPWGVTIHWITEGIDDGDIAFQRPIEKSWEDTGASLYARAQTEMVALFRDSFDRIWQGDIPRIPQREECASFHREAEVEAASRIMLDRDYSARRLLNVMRARTFPPRPGAWFEDDGERYEIELHIRRVRRP